MDAVQVSDLKLFPNEIKQLLQSKNGPVGKDLEKRVHKVAETARRLVPVDKGDLKASISEEVTTDSEGLVGAVTSDDEKVLAVEFGTRFQPGQSFLRPALRRP